MRKNHQKEVLEAYNTYAEPIYRHCFFRVFSKERAEEIVQETFLRVSKYLLGGNKIENMRAFLYRVANNLIIDESRKRKEESLDALIEESAAIEPSYDGHRETEKGVLLNEVRAVMRTLPEESQELLIMRYVDDLDPREIAEVLEITPNNASVRLNRAMQELKKRFNV